MNVQDSENDRKRDRSGIPPANTLSDKSIYGCIMSHLKPVLIETSLS